MPNSRQKACPNRLRYVARNARRMITLLRTGGVVYKVAIQYAAERTGAAPRWFQKIYYGQEAWTLTNALLDRVEDLIIEFSRQEQERHERLAREAHAWTDELILQKKQLAANTGREMNVETDGQCGGVNVLRRTPPDLLDWAEATELSGAGNRSTADQHHQTPTTERAMA